MQNRITFFFHRQLNRLFKIAYWTLILTAIIFIIVWTMEDWPSAVELMQYFYEESIFLLFPCGLFFIRLYIEIQSYAWRAGSKRGSDLSGSIVRSVDKMTETSKNHYLMLMKKRVVTEEEASYLRNTVSEHTALTLQSMQDENEPGSLLCIPTFIYRKGLSGDSAFIEDMESSYSMAVVNGTNLVFYACEKEEYQYGIETTNRIIGRIPLGSILSIRVIKTSGLIKTRKAINAGLTKIKRTVQLSQEAVPTNNVSTQGALLGIRYIDEMGVIMDAEFSVPTDAHITNGVIQNYKDLLICHSSVLGVAVANSQLSWTGIDEAFSDISSLFASILDNDFEAISDVSLILGIFKSDKEMLAFVLIVADSIARLLKSKDVELELVDSKHLGADEYGEELTGSSFKHETSRENIEQLLGSDRVSVEDLPLYSYEDTSESSYHIDEFSWSAMFSTLLWGIPHLFKGRIKAFLHSFGLMTGYFCYHKLLGMMMPYTLAAGEFFWAILFAFQYLVIATYAGVIQASNNYFESNTYIRIPDARTLEVVMAVIFVAITAFYFSFH